MTAKKKRETETRNSGSGSGVRFTCAAKQDDAKEKRNNERDGRDPDNEAGIGVPRVGESTRIGKVQTADH